MEPTTFDKRIKPLFSYVGTIGAVISIIAYIVVVFIMVFGISVTHSFSQTIVFALINAGIGLIVMQFLKIQGIDLAKRIEANIPVLEEYNKTRAKEKKLHSLRFFWITSVTKDVAIKCITLAATTIGIIYVVISASQNYTLLLLALVNIFMFICFGLLSLVKAYDFFNEEYIPFLKERINENKEKEATKEAERKKNADQRAAEREEIIEKEIQRRLALAKEELIKQRDVNLYDSRRNNILEPGVDNCTTCFDIQPVVVDNNNCNNNVLGGSVYTSDTSSNGVDTIVEENTSKNIKTEEQK